MSRDKSTYSTRRITNDQPLPEHSRASEHQDSIERNPCLEVLEMWICENEGASFWADVFNNLKACEVGEIHIIVTDGLNGMPETIESHFWPCTKRAIRLIHASTACVAADCTFKGLGMNRILSRSAWALHFIVRSGILLFRRNKGDLPIAPLINSKNTGFLTLLTFPTTSTQRPNYVTICYNPQLIPRVRLEALLPFFHAESKAATSRRLR